VPTPEIEHLNENRWQDTALRLGGRPCSRPFQARDARGNTFSPGATLHLGRRRRPRYRDPDIANAVAWLLSTEPDFEVLTANSIEAAQKLFAARPFDVILTDPLAGQREGFELLEWTRRHYRNTRRLFMTGALTLRERVETAITSGLLLGCIWKPFRLGEVVQFVRHAINTECGRKLPCPQRGIPHLPWP
jgi:CheY-like chemotaxis protein